MVFSSKDQVRKAAESIKDDAVDAANNASERATAAAEAALERILAIEEKLGKRASRAADALSARLKAAGLDADSLGDTAREHAGALQDKLVTELRERPLRTLGLAAAIGVILGMWSSR